MKYTASALAVAGMAATVRAHGFISSPQARMPGSAFQAACGQQVYYNQQGDNYGNVQGELQVAATQSDYNAEECNIWLCKGFKYDDNKDSVQTYTAGQKVDIKFEVRAPHTGTANVSIVDTATNSIIGSPLISWDDYASNSATIPASQTSFSITIPEDLGDKCSTAGACVIQHWWDARSIDQTYESCIDFTVGGSGSGVSSGSSSSAAASSKAPVSSQAAASSKAPASSQAAVSSKAPVSSQAAASSKAPVTTQQAVVSSSSSVASKAPVTSAAVSSAVAKPTTLATVVKSSAAAPASSSSSSSGTAVAYGRCGGNGYTGPTACPDGYTCTVQNPYYSQCLAGTNAKVNVVSSSAAVSSTSSCTSTVTLTRSSSAAPTGTDVAPTGVSASATGSSDLSSAVAQLSSAIPSSVLTATATAAASSTSTAKPIPEGFTLKDCLDWINYIVSEQKAASQQ